MRGLPRDNFGSFRSIPAWCRAFVLASLFAASAAAAADLPSAAAPPVMPTLPPAAYDWTGLYVGVNGGVGLDHFGVPSFITVPGTPGFATFTGINSRGPALGGQIGYNYELTNLPFIGHAVVGAELDADWADLTGRNTVDTAVGPATFGTRFEDFATARLRLGYDFDRLLVYLTGGTSYGTTNSYYNVAGFSGSETISYARLPPWVIVGGIGAEYALTNNLSVKAEYIYDYLLEKYDTFSTPTTYVGFIARADYSFVRLGLNYKLDLFSPPTPIGAKY